MGRRRIALFRSRCGWISPSEGKRIRISSLADLFPQDIAADDAGNLFLLNRSDAYIARYDRSGRRTARYGRKGAGPGELSRPGGITVASDGSVWTYDGAKRALVGFGADGRARPTIEMQRVAAPQRYSFGGDGWLVFMHTRSDTAYLRRLKGDAAEVVTRMALPPNRPVDATTCGLAGHERRPVFSPQLLFAVRGERVVWIDGPEFLVRLQDGARRAEIGRSRNPQPASETLARRELVRSGVVQVQGQPRCVIPADNIIRGASFAPVVPAYQDLLLDRAARLWAVRTTLPGDPFTVDLFSPSGEYLGTASLGQERPVAFLSDGRLVALRRDEDDVPVVSVFRVASPAFR